MREYRNGNDRARSFDYAPARSEASRDTAATARREPAAEVRAQLDAAEQTIATIVDVSIPKLATAEPSDADRRPARERRAAYNLARESVDAQFRSVATSRRRVEAYAAQHQVDAAPMLQAFDQKVAAARASLAAAPPAPLRFERVPGEDEIAAAIAMPAGSERNTDARAPVLAARPHACARARAASRAPRRRRQPRGCVQARGRGARRPAGNSRWHQDGARRSAQRAAPAAGWCSRRHPDRERHRRAVRAASTGSRTRGTLRCIADPELHGRRWAGRPTRRR